MTDHTNLITPRDWQILAQAEAADGYAARMAEARRYGAMADALEAAQAENAQWRVDFKEMVIERNAALARLAEIEAGASPVEPSQALVVEPVYQYQLANGNWIDQTKESYDYNVKHGQATVRMLYVTPQAAPLYAKETK